RLCGLPSRTSIGGVVHEDKVLRMEHLHIFQAGHKLGWEQIMAADELVIHIPGSKTDIYNDGYKLNIKLRAGDTPSDINPSMAEVAAPSKRGPSAFILAYLIETELNLPSREDLTCFL
ncbi:hypothetical protein AURANDRAFT_68451, partial [Aureococcus anophagefferens]